MADYTTKNIATGVRLCAVTTDRFKTGRLTLTMCLPLNAFAAANALLPYVLHRSCQAHPTFTAMQQKLASLYGANLGASVTKRGETQLLQITISGIDDRFTLDGEAVQADCAALLAELLFAPNLKDGAFAANDIELEKRLMLERIASETDDKRLYAKQKCEEIMCRNEAYGIPRHGTPDQVSALTCEDIYAAWQRVLHTARIQITMVGSSDSNKIAAIFAEKFHGMERTPCQVETVFVPAAKAVTCERETQSVKQGKLVLGLRTGMEHAKDNWAAFMVMNDVFGGSPSSKLFTVVREKMSLCYYCSARLDRQKGIIMVQSGIETDKETAAKEAILAQLEAVKQGDFTDEDLKASHLSICDTLHSYYDDPDVLSIWFGAYAGEETIKSPEEISTAVQAVTKEQVIAAAKRVTLDTVFMLAGEVTQ